MWNFSQFFFNQKLVSLSQAQVHTTTSTIKSLCIFYILHSSFFFRQKMENIFLLFIQKEKEEKICVKFDMKKKSWVWWVKISLTDHPFPTHFTLSNFVWEREREKMFDSSPFKYKIYTHTFVKISRRPFVRHFFFNSRVRWGMIWKKKLISEKITECYFSININLKNYFILN